METTKPKKQQTQKAIVSRMLRNTKEFEEKDYKHFITLCNKQIEKRTEIDAIEQQIKELQKKIKTIRTRKKQK